MLDPAIVRNDFPELKASSIAFLDNAASTLKPLKVIDAMREFSLTRYANVHRGVYKLSMEASIAYDKAREKVASFIKADPREVVFTYNSTDSLRRLALILLHNKIIREGDEILVTQAEHHSNMLPWRGLALLVGARLRVLPVDSEGVPRWDLVDEYLSDRTKIVAFAHVSNVTGSIAPVRIVADKARDAGALVVLDSAQGAPHLEIDVKKLGVDFMVFSGHKMLGPTGIGVLWMRRELSEELEPLLGGGGTIKDVRQSGPAVDVEWEEPPFKWEPGTPPIIESIGLSAAVEYLESIGMDSVTRYEEELTKALFDLLSDRLKEKITILGPRDPGRRLGIVSFTLEGYTPDAVGLYLSTRGIAVRTGKHCAHPLHYALGASQGSVRASLYLYNTLEDIEKLVSSLQSIAK
ncbi:MAG: cysteine desulfurase [Desulfurococcales archaeon]|nr:cysteine desulfurase [Desulfurococcales archaeon]